MTNLAERFRRISAFIYILVFLLVFYFFFNLHYQWYGISLIVRIYIYVFCFYLVFIFSSMDIDHHEREYEQRYGKHGERILFLKARVLPFLVIYAIITAFALIDGMGRPDWPWNPFLKMLNGTFSNLIIYSLFLLFVLKLRKDPMVTIPIFLLLCVSYFFLDTLLQSTIQRGLSVHLSRFLKFLIFFYLLFIEFFVRRSLVKMLATAFAVSMTSYVLYTASYFLIFEYSPDMSYQRREAGTHLLRLGFASPFDDLKRVLLRSPEPALFGMLLFSAHERGVELSFEGDEWERLLFSGSMEMSEFVSAYLVNKRVEIPFERFVSYAREKSTGADAGLMNAVGFMRLAARSLPGRERDMEGLMRSSDGRFVQWCIAVLGEYGNVESIPLLLEYLTDIDPNLAEASYGALTKITGEDPRGKLGKRINDADVVVFFKEYFLRHRKGT